MLVTHIEQGYRVSIPEPFRQSLQVGDELAIEMDDNGRMILIPTRRILDILDRTAGLWQSHQGMIVTPRSAASRSMLRAGEGEEGGHESSVSIR